MLEFNDDLEEKHVHVTMLSTLDECVIIKEDNTK